MNEMLDCKMFRPVLAEQMEYGKSPGPGRLAKDLLLIVKRCVLRDLHGLSDGETEFQVLDRTSFRRFLGMSVDDKITNPRDPRWEFRASGLQLHGLKKARSHHRQLVDSRWLPSLLPCWSPAIKVPISQPQAFLRSRGYPSVLWTPSSRRHPSARSSSTRKRYSASF